MPGFRVSMKVIFYHSNPFFLTHGGAQTLIEAIMAGTAGLGGGVEPARWWDDQQKGDIIHFMGRPPMQVVEAARRNNYGTMLTENIDQTSSRPRYQLWLRRTGYQVDRILGGRFLFPLHTKVYQMLDAIVHVVEL